MLSSLEIKNFKGIKTGTISELAQVNVLVGRNNSGKSTILDALLLMGCAFSRQNYLEKDGLQEILSRKINRGTATYQELRYMTNTEAQLFLTGKFANGGQVGQEWQPENEMARVTLTAGMAASKSKWAQPSSQLTVDQVLLNLNQNWSGSGDISMDNIRVLLLGHLIDPNSIRESFLEKLWGKIVVDRHDRGLREMINDVFELNAEGFSLMPYGGITRLVVLLPEHGIPVDWFGDGLRYALNILALGMLLEGTILMVEELETHQHPDSLKKLTQTLFELAQKQNLQLFLTTHSWELMAYALEAAEQTGVGLTFHHVRLSEKGEFDARAIPQPDAKILADIGHDIRLQDKYIGAS